MKIKITQQSSRKCLILGCPIILEYMTNVLDDESLGLWLKGYRMVPNDALENKIAVYTTEVVQSILAENPQIVDRWLQQLHAEYLFKKRSCDFDNDPVACFALSVYEEFEKHLKSWEEGGLIEITLPRNQAIRVSKKPLISFVKTPTFVCDTCLHVFGAAKEMVDHYKSRHPEHIEKVTIPV